MQSLRMRDSKRPRAEVFAKQAAEMSTRYAETVGQPFDVAIVQGAISDEP